MNKLEMAQRFAEIMLAAHYNNTANFESPSEFSSIAWKYADAMQAEADKREKQKAIDEYSSPEWQPDWSQAPDDCCFFCVASNGGYGFFTNLEPEFMGDYFYVGCGGLMIENHGYTGDWRNSLRKRP